MTTSLSRLDSVIPPISVTRFDAGRAALRPRFDAPRPENAVVEGRDDPKAAGGIATSGVRIQSPIAPDHGSIETDVLKVAADVQLDHLDKVAAYPTP